MMRADGFSLLIQDVLFCNGCVCLCSCVLACKVGVIRMSQSKLVRFYLKSAITQFPFGVCLVNYLLFCLV